mmetsp:Transcript_101791/g.206809  ORF Transcript_101791/g.206809 Transcript_101791/m.206809 type:complete len:93 (+) Transcript_101791:53-331(+)
MNHSAAHCFQSHAYSQLHSLKAAFSIAQSVLLFAFSKTYVQASMKYPLNISATYENAIIETYLLDVFQFFFLVSDLYFYHCCQNKEGYVCQY